MCLGKEAGQIRHAPLSSHASPIMAFINPLVSHMIGTRSAVLRIYYELTHRVSPIHPRARRLSQRETRRRTVAWAWVKRWDSQTPVSSHASPIPRCSVRPGLPHAAVAIPAYKRHTPGHPLCPIHPVCSPTLCWMGGQERDGVRAWVRRRTREVCPAPVLPAPHPSSVGLVASPGLPRAQQSCLYPSVHTAHRVHPNI
jgi:hypothetical protein